MKINIISEINGLKDLQKVWDNLFFLGQYSIFQSFDFNYYSWKLELCKNSRNKLCVISIKDNEKIYAILPLYVDSRMKLRFINDNHADFCDIISMSAINFSDLYNYLKQEIIFKSISLINIKANTNIHNSVIDWNRKNIVVKLISEYSTLNIDRGDFPYNVPHFRSHQKHRINKAIRKNEDKKSIVFEYKKNDFPKKDILLLADKMIQLGVRKKGFFSEERLLLIEYLYNSGSIIIHMLISKDKIHSCNIITRDSAATFMFWIDLYDDSQMINISSYICFMKSVSFDQAVVVNFGRGKYFYKVSNFNPFFRDLYQINIFFNIWDKLCHLFLSQTRVVFASMYKKVKK